VDSAGLGGRVLLVSLESYQDIFESIRMLVVPSGEKVLCTVDDMASFQKSHHHKGMSRDVSSLLATVKPLFPRLTLVLVNQLRHAGDAVVGAAGYRVCMQMSSTALHLGPAAPLYGPAQPSEVGVTATGRVLKSDGKAMLLGGQPEFRMDTVFLRGVCAAYEYLENRISDGSASISGKYVMLDGPDHPGMVKSKDWVEYYDKKCAGAPAGKAP
jgi:hypothetical protein